MLVAQGGYRKIKKRVTNLERLSKWKFTIPIEGYSIYNISCSDPILKVIALKAIFLTMDTDDLSRPNLSLVSSFLFFVKKSNTVVHWYGQTYYLPILYLLRNMPKNFTKALINDPKVTNLPSISIVAWPGCMRTRSRVKGLVTFLHMKKKKQKRLKSFYLIFEMPVIGYWKGAGIAQEFRYPSLANLSRFWSLVNTFLACVAGSLPRVYKRFSPHLCS